ncbi:hypothetical protein [Massilia aerilata]|uniref:Transmembrane protein n=1 Tax=Massilia aerilata TaxID=453817 RepID=A0ABW0S145_9BURK
MRTLDERRAAQAARDNPPPRPSYEQRDARTPPPPQGYGYGYGNAPAPAQAPVIINQGGGGGLGHVIAGAVLANSVANAHARNNNNANNNGGGYYPAPSGSAGGLANQAGAGSVGGSTGAPVTASPGAPAPAAPAKGGSVFGTIVWLAVLALIGWVVYRLWKRAKARRAADKPNYSFERN